MDDDPKNPMAWWAVKLRWPQMHPQNLSKAQKKRMAWIYAIVLVLGSIEVFYMIKLMRMN
jgi:hypothetical protein